MTIEKAIGLARKWAAGHVCTLKEGEAQEYHQMCADALEKSRWISVEERLPNNRENLKYFLCRCILDGDNDEKWAFYQVLRWYVYDIGDDGSYFHPHFQDDGYDGMSVTHWMPLPEPPEAETHEKDGADG